VDESGDVPVTVKYYYDEVDEVVITICSDEKHMPLFEKVLDSIKMDNR
jgi:heterodisulfide reductase subunit A-like polyferredoxin